MIDFELTNHFAVSYVTDGILGVKFYYANDFRLRETDMVRLQSGWVPSLRWMGWSVDCKFQRVLQ